MIVTIEEAINIILETTKLLSTEIIPIENAVSKISSIDIRATLPLPSFNNSAMDGYALMGTHSRYKIIGKLLAGDEQEYTLRDGECVRIMTGAATPKDTQMVIPQENVAQENNEIVVNRLVEKGANVRLRGEDIDIGDIILNRGDTVNSSHIGLLASQGITHIEVFKRPKVAIFASGNELKLHFEKIKKSQIYNSNTPYLMARVEELKCESSFVGRSEDTIESLVKLIKNSMDADLIITSGGVSVGEADYTKEAFKKAGVEVLFDKVMIKPGKPTTFGKIGSTLVLNLPGNPLASALNFEIFGKIILAKMSGSSNCYHNYLNVKIKNSYKKSRAVDTILPGKFDGESFDNIKKFSAGMVNVLNHCNGFIIIDKDKEYIEKNELVKFMPIEWNFFSKSFVNFKS